jgi:hypothetical protein
MVMCERNITALTERLAAPLLGQIEFAPAPDPRHIARQLTLPHLP